MNQLTLAVGMRLMRKPRTHWMNAPRFIAAYLTIAVAGDTHA